MTNRNRREINAKIDKVVKSLIETKDAMHREFGDDINNYPVELWGKLQKVHYALSCFQVELLSSN